MNFWLLIVFLKCRNMLVWNYKVFLWNFKVPTVQFIETGDNEEGRLFC